MGAAFASVFVASFAIFYLIKATYGLRVKPDEERHGLDLVEHGMWGYPEQFMPVPGSEYHHPARRGRDEGLDRCRPRGRRREPAAEPRRASEEEDGMKKVEAIIRAERLQAVQDALDGIGASGLTVTEVLGCGRQKGYTEQYRGSRANISLLPKIKVESVLPDHVIEQAVEAIVAAAHTGQPGDGRIFVLADRAGGAHPYAGARRGGPPPRNARGVGPLDELAAAPDRPPSRRGVFFPPVQENRIAVDRGDGVAVVVVEGEHDVYTAPSLSEQLDALLDEGMPFVIDLTPATFVDSSVLRVLLEARRRADERGVGFAVALGQDDSGPVRRVLDITGLVPVLPVHSGRDAAIEAARSEAA